MESASKKPGLLAIVGPTASGKSELAIKIAKEFNGEIIAADSRTIYKGMDIGTAKPTKEEQKLIPHWGLDLGDPGQAFNAFEFKKYAEQKITEIKMRGNLPILVGGSGLYIDAVLFDYGFVDEVEPKLRAELEKQTMEQLQNIVKKHGYEPPNNIQNRRHLIRTIERKGVIGNKCSLKDNIVIFGLMPAADVLKERIYKRAETYYSNGLVEEIENLLNKYDEETLNKAHGIAYAATVALLKKEVSKKEALEMIQKREWQYARRQRTWFRRNTFIRWFDNSEQAYKEIVRILNN
jgi:tRNA dimethylallyltransferase